MNKFIVNDPTFNINVEFKNLTELNKFLRKDGWKRKWLKKREIADFNDNNTLQIYFNERSKKNVKI